MHNCKKQMIISIEHELENEYEVVTFFYIVKIY